MRKRILVALYYLLLACFVYSESVTDYFPTKLGDTSIYNTTDIVSGKLYIRESQFIEQTAIGGFPGETLILIKTLNEYGSSSKIYSITDDRVALVLSEDIFGKQRAYQPYPVVFKFDGSWSNNTDSDEYDEYQAETGSCTVNGIQYSDCIVITKFIYLSGKVFGKEISYYAKEIGLVFQKRIDSMGIESNIKTYLVSYSRGN